VAVRRTDGGVGCGLVPSFDTGRCFNRPLHRFAVPLPVPGRIFQVSSILKIENLHATVGDKPIFKGLTLSLGAEEIRAIMGPNISYCVKLPRERSL
jgi:hypothetical protein